MVCFGKWVKFAGLLILLGVLVTVSGCGQVNVAANAPDDLYGAWQSEAVEGQVYHLLFMSDGEYRVATDDTLLYDAPLFLGRFQYDAGQLTLINAGMDLQECREPGQYVVKTYDNSGKPRLELARTDDKCDQRNAVLTATVWQLADADG